MQSIKDTCQRIKSRALARKQPRLSRSAAPPAKPIAGSTS